MVNPRLPMAIDGSLERLRTGDLPQYGLLLLASVTVILVATWPARAGLANESWYAVSQARSVLVALLALGYGMGLATEAPRRAASTALAVILLAVSTLPLELLAHAGSAPATPAWWAWAATPVAAAGHLVFGVLLGAVARRLRLMVLAPLLVPAFVAGTVAVDVRLGMTLLNPLTAALQVSVGFLALHAAVALLGAVLLAWRWRRHGVQA